MFLKLILVFLTVATVAWGFPSHDNVFKDLRDKLHTDGRINSLGVWGGNKSTITKHPYIATFWDGKTFLGAGVIVSDSWILSVPEEFTYIEPTNFTVVVGANDGVHGKRYKINQTINHPKHERKSLDYAYTCLQIDGKFKWSPKVQPLPLATAKLPSNTELAVAGFGGTSSEAEESSVLMEGTMSLWPDIPCKKYFHKIYFDLSQERSSCAYNKGSTTLCTNDWGDAFVYNGSLYGMMTAGGPISVDCSSKAKPVVLATIHSVADWIKSTTGAKYDIEV